MNIFLVALLFKSKSFGKSSWNISSCVSTNVLGFYLFFAEKRSLLRSDKEGQRLALLSAEKRSGLKSEKGGPTMMAEHGTRGDLWNVLCFV